MHDSLLLGTRPERLRELATVLSGPGAPASLEAALPDLLREGDDVVLSAVATGLSGFRADASGGRVLETLARRSGAVRAAALRALRGETAAAVAPVGVIPAPAARTSETPAPRVAPPASAAETTPPAPAHVPAADWAAPFEAVLADPTAEAVRRAALALLELAEARPAAATQEALRELAGRLAMASFDHEGSVQQGLARLAKGLKGL